MNRFFVFLVLFVFFACSKETEETVSQEFKMGEWTSNFESASEYAKKNNKMVLLNFTGSDWCVYCIKMEKGVFKTKEWKNYSSNNLATVFLDFPKNKTVPAEQKKRNQKLMKKYEITGFPTFILLDSEGNYLERLGYARTAPEFIEKIDVVYYLSDSFAKNTELSDKNKKEYDTLKKSYDYSVAALQKWLKTKPARNDDNNKKYEKFNEKIRSDASMLINFCKSL